ncbi:SDR family NAD(P)-dependent oxidoreductase [Cupriavidus metallidurans]|jgi:short-subunit dehydrogenase|uniref:SDR family NAD(P)-dependent oxidoreductase n=1 Tax=Cupriavidus metallidurans TaxID=119219 RepID=A0A482IWK7_9BURK|nr:SDR family NAD(P)-dependent oxidoreductase [Cupriavidus metallidurans]QBP13475.1 SDR family NAD(P)-dependent oxidoreductase [Cupriavidus metallidurans]
MQGLSLNPRWTDWTGKRVWIVGASSGIGAELARTLLARGANVAVSGRRADALAAVVEGQPRGLALPMDARVPADWVASHDALCKTWDAVDMVVFCAAEYRPLRPWEIDAEEARRTVETNLCSVYYGLAAVLPAMMVRQGGSVVLLASVAGYLGLPNATIYGPTKAALINLAELLYAELHPHGIGVYLVNPGFVKTRLTAHNDFAMPALQTTEAAAASILSGLARGRFEIAFPSRFTVAMRLLSRLPYRLRLRLLQRLMKTP